ncbi:2-succinyl-5-enolpyruvyl-6-hydroxy-3-cyclohexene-1-carboxylic-acid synthase [Thiorhodococcus mannitoliphagus]|uniref:2-succinyl-5-enolpyruvyl-6-hydroxy-3-cyclohexene-1-carboxylate synthase n=1 Tax=Thiorhodococcus mannitoliphagus TaxID=329406 RepID=A0A6P1DY32_9GAMM|nr:2-succinyl-5-enolpyruvyl-6-hydroxy-3-cyclohexene-1-carboxylic-acid synthase [Thiorhodococcus mannitoliphagus]NEX22609.1 2-succinyl-5-enolpyruvyl-6-hydroxy-3-cyclohexene-1-carboxylic-acid synthase [Thiorhodococcus mannitoliphagus]
MSSQQSQACINLQWSLALMDGLIEGGMRRLIVSPGSRSTPLVLAGQRRPGLELTAILDERSAAFFALGLARASGRPVGILCTSGSAPAHWLPAVIEASESEIPLILLSADRPPELRGWGANQTIDQSALFSGYIRGFHDPGPAEDTPGALKMIRALGLRAATTSRSSPPGPIHLNLPFREPLVPSSECSELIASPPTTSPLLQRGARGDFGRHRSHQEAIEGHLLSAAGCDTAAESRTQSGPTAGQDWPITDRARAHLDELPLSTGCGVICCGPGALSKAAADALWKAAMVLNVPVLCDPLSGLRFGPAGPGRITRYDSFLRNAPIAEALKPDWVLRIGRAPVSKTLLGWLADRPTILLDPGGRWSDPNHDVRWRLRLQPEAFFELILSAEWERDEISPRQLDWLHHWLSLEAEVDRRARQYLQAAPWCEAHLIATLLDKLPGGEGLLCANSMPIRQLDTWSGSREASLEVFGNRGASGIDGQTSTLAGLGAGGIPTTGLLGDLSFLHDLSGLLLGSAFDRPCVVINNGGGRIFDYLPQHGLPGFERFWRTPVQIELGNLLAGFGVRHRLAAGPEALSQALDEALDEALRAESRLDVIEVVVDADTSRETHLEFWRSLSSLNLGE